jgi:hypothetical protein
VSRICANHATAPVCCRIRAAVGALQSVRGRTPLRERPQQRRSSAHQTRMADGLLGDAAQLPDRADVKYAERIPSAGARYRCRREQLDPGCATATLQDLSGPCLHARQASRTSADRPDRHRSQTTVLDRAQGRSRGTDELESRKMPDFACPRRSSDRAPLLPGPCVTSTFAQLSDDSQLCVKATLQTHRALFPRVPNRSSAPGDPRVHTASLSNCSASDPVQVEGW